MPETAKFETKVFTLTEAKVIGDGGGPGRLSGWASIKGNVDSYGDVIMEGAYTNLDTMIKDGWSGFNHGSNPIGYFTDAKEDSKGLFVEIEFHSTPDAQEMRTKAQERIAAGKSVGMSIMFKTIESARVVRDDEEIRELRQIEVVEAGFVMMPANKAALVASVKSEHGVPFDEQVETLLDGLKDCTGRLETFRKDRSQGLSPKNIEKATALRDALTELIDNPKAEALPEVKHEEVCALTPSW